MEMTVQTPDTSTPTPEKTFPVPADAAGMRLDLLLLRQLPDLGTRAEVQRLIKAGAVSITGKRVVKPSTSLRAGLVITVKAPRAGSTKHQAPGFALRATPGEPSSKISPLRILHEDSQLLVVDKPAGVPVHPGVKREPTIAETLVERYPALKSVGEPTRGAGIVHRLDKDTSGVLLVARTQAMYEHLKGQFQQRRIHKVYVALVHGVVTENTGVVKLPIIRSKSNPLRRTVVLPEKARGRARGKPPDTTQGKAAETSFRVRERFREHTLLDVFPRTGRMHQIRVHLTHLGFPVAGDTLYGRKSRSRTPQGLRRQFLHAAALTVELPNSRTKTFHAPLPDDLVSVLAALRTAPAPPAKPTTYRWKSPRAPRT